MWYAQHVLKSLMRPAKTAGKIGVGADGEETASSRQSPVVFQALSQAFSVTNVFWFAWDFSGFSMESPMPLSKLGWVDEAPCRLPTLIPHVILHFPLNQPVFQLKKPV